MSSSPSRPDTATRSTAQTTVLTRLTCPPPLCRFHFSCVGLTAETAAQIEAYSCDMCEQMGMGSTRSECISFSAFDRCSETTPVVPLLVRPRRQSFAIDSLAGCSRQRPSQPAPASEHDQGGAAEEGAAGRRTRTRDVSISSCRGLARRAGRGGSWLSERKRNHNVAIAPLSRSPHPSSEPRSRDPPEG